LTKFGNQRLDLGSGAHVGLEVFNGSALLPKFRDCFFAGAGFAVHHRHHRIPVGEFSHASLANPRTRAGYHHHFASEVHAPLLSKSLSKLQLHRLHISTQTGLPGHGTGASLGIAKREQALALQ
jgi:hypothetical protein